MRPKQHATTGSGDLFRARLEQIINMKHELVALELCRNLGDEAIRRRGLTTLQ